MQNKYILKSLKIHDKYNEIVQNYITLLDKIQKITAGKSLEANIQLVFNNVRLATQIATELSKLNK